jgi:hypothetical protein
MAEDMNPQFEEDQEDPKPKPLSLAWRLAKIAAGDKYMILAANMLEEGRAGETTDEELLGINQMVQTAVMMAQANYMAANIRVSEAPKQTPGPAITRTHPSIGMFGESGR